MSQDGAVEDRGSMASSNGKHTSPIGQMLSWAARLGTISHKGTSAMLLAIEQ